MSIKRLITQFTTDDWKEFRERLECLQKFGCLTERNYKLLYEIIVERRSTTELASLGRTSSDFDWLRSDQNKPMSSRRIQQILTEYFPEFCILSTQSSAKKTSITESSRCAKCGIKEKLLLHQMIPESIGGDNSDENLVVLCESCHQKANVYNKGIIHTDKKQ